MNSSNLMLIAPDLLRGLMVLGVCSVRLYVVMTLFPPTADGILQGVVRNGVVLLFSANIAFAQPASFAASLTGMHLLEVGLREALIGVVFGFSASTVFWIAEGAGTYLDYLSGYNNAQVVNPMRSEQSTPSATLLSQMAIMAFWLLGGMMFLLEALYDSYKWWPIASSAPVSTNYLDLFAMRQTDTLMETIAKIASPMLLVLILVDLGFGIAAKSGEKLELNSLSQPVKGAVTVLLLALFAAVFIHQVRDQLDLRLLGAQLQALAHQH
ncbi:MAG: type III secretion system export apparatus subunit SctT [Janthinobacterium lividum]